VGQDALRVPITAAASAAFKHGYGDGAGEYTVHGFRSSFRDWAAEHGVEFELAEQCLAHKVGNAVTQAYLRSTALERRRVVMDRWAQFLAGEENAKVIPFAGRS
jgi:integrase